MKSMLYCLLLAAMLPNATRSETITFQSAARQTALLELYSSEGCSSCPPAEAWLSGLKESPGLWKDFVPVAFHVDYWDHLGWRDPWAARAFTERQRTYAAAWRAENIYTPEFVLDGREWSGWSPTGRAPKPSAAKPGILSVTSADTNQWQVSFAPAGPGGGNYEVHAALLAGGSSSDVKAGENRGRRLVHDFVVLKLVNAPLKRDGDAAQGVFDLATPAQPAGSSVAIAVWVTQAGQLEPVQATGGWIVRTASNH